MPKAKSRNTIGSFAVEVERMRVENAKARPLIARNAQLERENDELRRQLRKAFKPGRSAKRVSGGDGVDVPSRADV